MQGKKKLAGLFPILLILVFLFLWTKSGLFSKSEVEVPLTSLESSTEKALVLLPSESDFVYVGSTLLPLVSEAVTEVSLPKETVVETKKESVDVMAPLLPLVTEFHDAYEVVVPKETEKISQSEKPALVTGFTGTLPLSLPVASPVVQEDEMRAVYVASAYNLDFPSRAGLSKKELEKELDTIVAQAFSCG